MSARTWQKRCQTRTHLTRLEAAGERPPGRMHPSQPCSATGGPIHKSRQWIFSEECDRQCCSSLLIKSGASTGNAEMIPASCPGRVQGAAHRAASSCRKRRSCAAVAPSMIACVRYRKSPARSGRRHAQNACPALAASQTSSQAPASQQSVSGTPNSDPGAPHTPGRPRAASACALLALASLTASELPWWQVVWAGSQPGFVSAASAGKLPLPNTAQHRELGRCTPYHCQQRAVRGVRFAGHLRTGLLAQQRPQLQQERLRHRLAHRSRRPRILAQRVQCAAASLLPRR